MYRLEGYYALLAAGKLLAERQHTRPKRAHTARPMIIARMVARLRRNSAESAAERDTLLQTSRQIEAESAC